MFKSFGFRPGHQGEQGSHEDVLEQPIPHGPSRLGAYLRSFRPTLPTRRARRQVIGLPKQLVSADIGPSPSGGGEAPFASTIARTAVSSATLCSAITSSIGCCSPCASAASAHTGHHTCWHFPGESPRPIATAAAERTAGSRRSRIGL